MSASEWLPISEAKAEQDNVVVAFVDAFGREYARRRICDIRERDWPHRYEFWDMMQRVHPTHFLVIPAIGDAA
ncbi:hypothetical protein [Sphingomonas sp.]|uniref:hypothetical protein n=1 Tax=Sphingomonas sp. TaxID=28214 RepID=UPI002896D1AE|nr:hypothetical protein [Sphingomonas sp.]